MSNKAIIAIIAGVVLVGALLITLAVKNFNKSVDIESLATDLGKATNKVQFLSGQLEAQRINYTSLHGRALAIETERDTLVAEKAKLIADQARLLQGVTNAFSGQVTTLEQEKSALEQERDLLDQRSKSLLTNNAVLAKQIFALTNTTARTRASSGGIPTHIIQTGSGIGSASSSFTTNGVAGGVPALFVNKAEQTVVMTVRGNGVTFTLELKARNGVKRFDILPGEYAYNYTVGDDPTLLPETGSATFTVDEKPSHYLEGQGAFHGGAIFRGKQ